MTTALLFALALQTTPPLASDTRYDESIPTLRQVAGHDFGEEVTAPRDVVAYFDALAEAGFTTGAFVANAGYLGPKWGLDRGFATYEAVRRPADQITDAACASPPRASAKSGSSSIAF